LFWGLRHWLAVLSSLVDVMNRHSGVTGGGTVNKDKPRVSVGLPVFNGERYLAEALDSILAQTYSDFELIISDNASTDRTPEICEAYAARDLRIQYHRSATNLGASPNFNRVFELSSGEYFKWAAHDDVIAPDFLLQCVAALDQNPDVVLCYPRARLIDERGVRLGDYNPRPDTFSSKPQERFRNLILAPHMALQVFGLIRASALRKTDLIGNYPASDEVLLAELALLGKFYELPERLFFSRIHSGQSIRGPLSVQRARVGWFDTAQEGKIVLAHWRYFFECLRVLRRTPLSAYQRAYCCVQMGHWLLLPPRFRAMGKDLIIAGNQILHSWLLKPRFRSQWSSRKERGGS
jgi:glycosyltransferase involved in cell wall biosynthesis